MLYTLKISALLPVRQMKFPVQKPSAQIRFEKYYIYKEYCIIGIQTSYLLMKFLCLSSPEGM
jgi:hypothetical protein